MAFEAGRPRVPAATTTELSWQRKVSKPRQRSDNTKIPRQWKITIISWQRLPTTRAKQIPIYWWPTADESRTGVL